MWRANVNMCEGSPDVAAMPTSGANRSWTVKNSRHASSFLDRCMQCGIEILICSVHLGHDSQRMGLLLEGADVVQECLGLSGHSHGLVHVALRKVHVAEHDPSDAYSLSGSVLLTGEQATPQQLASHLLDRCSGDAPRKSSQEPHLSEQRPRRGTDSVRSLERLVCHTVLAIQP